MYQLLLQVAAYDTVAKKMAFFDPSRAKDFLFISGTKVCSYIVWFPCLSQIGMKGSMNNAAVY